MHPYVPPPPLLHPSAPTPTLYLYASSNPVYIYSPVLHPQTCSTIGGNSALIAQMQESLRRARETQAASDLALVLPSLPLLPFFVCSQLVLMLEKLIHN